MKRDPDWKQEDPMTQLRVLLGSIDGDLSNIIEGIVTGDRIRAAAGRAFRHAQQANKLAAAIARGDTKWDVESVTEISKSSIDSEEHIHITNE